MASHSPREKQFTTTTPVTDAERMNKDKAVIHSRKEGMMTATREGREYL
ncbi:MAG: hypothetical protein ACFFD4_39735 [Candidatus Odinarchaeota archaeon]